MKSNKIFTGLTLLLFVVSVASCDPSTINGKTQSASFFDLKKYFKKEIRQLEKIKVVEKSVEINGSKETNQISNISFEKDLSVFSDSDINRLSWEDKYSVDSINDNKSGELTALKYVALNNEMKTQLLLISFKEEVVDSIIVQNQGNGFATKNTKQMTYVPKLGYIIESKQKTLFGTEKKRVEKKIVVDVRFIH